MHSLRLPSFIVSTEVVFAADGERLSIRHDAGESAAPYVAGTLLAIRAVAGRVGLTRGLDQLLDPSGGSRGAALSWTGSGCFWSRGSWRLMSSTSRSAMSWLKPRLTTTRSAARSVAVLRERVGGHQPAALAQRVRDVEDGEVVDAVVEREREHRQLVAAA